MLIGTAARTRRYLARRALSAGVALAFTCAGTASAQPRLDVRIASQASMPPKWVHLRGGVSGLCPDILAAVERVEPRLHFVGYRRPRSLPAIEAGLESGELDMACGLVPSPRRHALAAPVGPPLYVARHRLVARRDDPAEVRSIDDLVRLQALVVGPRGTTFAARLGAAGVRIDDATDDNALNLRKIVAGHGRFLDMNDLTLRHYLRYGDVADRVRVMPDLVVEEPAYFWVGRKTDARLGRLLGPALATLKASGELERIYLLRATNP